MKAIIIGLGSIGKRHQTNLRNLGCDVVSVDPVNPDADYDTIDDWEEYGDGVDFAVVCSPTEFHYTQCIRLFGLGIPVLCEKPMWSAGQYDRREEFIGAIVRNPRVPFAVAYCYRFHPVFRHLKSIGEDLEYLHLFAGDDMISKYGPTALETMASHSIDAALWVAGPARKCRLSDAKSHCAIAVDHPRCSTHIFCDIAAPHREAQALFSFRGGNGSAAIGRDDNMYIEEMKAWLNYLATGDRGDLCSFDEAMQVQEVMWG